MRIRTNFYVSLDGFVAPPDGRPVQLLLSPVETEPLGLTLRATRAFPDGVVELRYSVGEAP